MMPYDDENTRAAWRELKPLVWLVLVALALWGVGAETGNGRSAIYIDLNPAYLELARQRIGPLLCAVT